MYFNKVIVRETACIVLFSYLDSPLQESMKALLEMRRTSKEKETQALLAGEQDPCSCYIEVCDICNMLFFIKVSYIQHVSAIVLAFLLI